VEHLSGVGTDGRPAPIESLSSLNGKVAEMLRTSLMNEMLLYMEKVMQ
jgi:hypothetical protein